METAHFKSWKAVFLLSIAIPVSLFSILRMTGIVEEPLAVKETTTLDTLQWQFTRPSSDEFIIVNDSINSIYAGDGISVRQRVLVAEYVPGSWGYSPPGPYFDLGIEISIAMANSNGFIQSVVISFGDFQPSEIVLLRTLLNPVNLSLVSVKDGKAESYINLSGVNRCSQAYFELKLFHWYLMTSSAEENHLQVRFEVTYYNGTAYNRVIQPFKLSISRASNE